MGIWDTFHTVVLIGLARVIKTVDNAFNAFELNTPYNSVRTAVTSV